MIKVWDYLKEYEELREEILDEIDGVFKRGTLVFTINIYQEASSGAKFSIEKVELRYRIVGGDGVWETLPNVKEYNNVSSPSISNDSPGGTNFAIDSAQPNNVKWYQTIRAFDYNTMLATSTHLFTFII